MKSTSQRKGDPAHQVGHEEDRALEHADEQQVAPAVVLGDLRAELVDAALERLLVDQDLVDVRVEGGPLRRLELGHAGSPAARSRRPPSRARSRCRGRRRRRRRARRAARPRAPSGAPSRPRRDPEPSCARPASRSPARQPRTRRPGRSRLEHASRPSGPGRRARPAPARARRGRTRARRRGRPRGRRAASPAGGDAGRRARARPARGSSAGGSRRARMFRSAAGWRRRSSGTISWRMRPRTRVVVRRVDAEGEPLGAAVRLGLVAPDGEERAHDAVVAPHADAGRRRRSTRAGRGSSRPGRRRCGPWRAAGRARPRSAGRAARPRCPCAPAPRRPRRRSARGRSARPRPTRPRAARGSRAAPSTR